MRDEPLTCVPMNQPVIKNVVFDVGGVLLEWDPPGFVAELYTDEAQRQRIHSGMFGHADWHEVDRGVLDGPAGVRHFSRATGLSEREIEQLFDRGRAALKPIAGTIQLLEDLKAAKVGLYVLSNMPESTWHYLRKRDAFFGHFDELVISGAIRLLKPEPAIYQHLIEKTGIEPAASVFIDDLERNVAAARAAGLHSFVFTTPEAARRELQALMPGVRL
jgi:putative hydrolase of the HAD superfamily